MDGPEPFLNDPPSRPARSSTSPRLAARRRSTVRARRARERHVVRRGVDAYNRRDIEALRTLFHAHVELDWSASRGPLAGVYRGIDAVIGFYREWFSTFEQIVVEPEELITGCGTVLVPNVALLRGRDDILVAARSVLEFTVQRQAGRSSATAAARGLGSSRRLRASLRCSRGGRPSSRRRAPGAR